MLYQWIRVLDGDNGTITDVSLANQDESSTIAMDLVVSEDYIYVGQHFPFNNIYFDVNTVNAVSADISIDYWAGQGNGWVAGVDILDDTSSAGVPLAKSGVVQFSPDRKYSWHRINDTENEPMPAGLETITIYNVYWMRISYNATLTAGTLLNRIVYLFTRSQQLDNIDTQINRFLDSFESGKTDWEDEIVTASQMLVADLRRRGLVTHYGQVLRFEDVTLAADLKTLILIYQNLGPGFRQKLEDARADYEKTLDMGRYTFDKNNDAFTDSGEITNKVKQLVR